MKATPAYWKLHSSRASSNRACSLRWQPELSGRRFSVGSVARPEGLLGPTQGDVDAVLLLTQQVLMKRSPPHAPSPMFINAHIMALQCYLCMLLRRPSLLRHAARCGRMRRACRCPHQCHSVFACHALEARLCGVWLRPEHASTALIGAHGRAGGTVTASSKCWRQLAAAVHLVERTYCVLPAGPRVFAGAGPQPGAFLRRGKPGGMSLHCRQ